MKLDRRQFSIGAVSAAALLNAPGCTGEPEDPDIRNFLNEGMNEGVESGVMGTTADLADLRANPNLIKSIAEVKNDVASGKLKPTSLEDVDSMDYSHFVRATADKADGPFGVDGAFASDAFAIDHNVLQSIVDAGSFGTELQGQETIIIGLRGAVLTAGDRAMGTSIDIHESRIDHTNPHCLVGLWRPAKKELALFTGSTAPNLVNMQIFLMYHFGQNNALPPGVKAVSQMCALLPQGVHTYRVNTHLPGHGEDRQMGCLRQDSATPVVRARSHLNYSLEELWDPLDWRPHGYNENSIRVIHANLHSATNRNSPPFASAACTTISGRYDPKPLKAVGAFEAFQAAMDIKIKPDGSGSTRDNEVYKYMLVTGREARLHREYLGDAEKLKGLRRLRIGSAGAPVAKLRKHIYGVADTRDVMDGAALQKLVQSQGAWAVARDGMWTPELDAAQAVKAWDA